MTASSITFGYASAAGEQVHYRRCGAAGPWLFLFHQSPFSSRQFERCLPDLGSFCRAVAFDTPGYGNSTVATKPHSLADYAVVLRGAIDALGARDLYLAGFHTGAGIALEIAAAIEPDRLRGLVLSGVPMLSRERLSALLAEMVPPFIASDGGHLTKEWTSRFGNWGAEGGVDQVHAAVVEALSVYPRYRWGFEALQRHDPAPLLRGLRRPVLFITSDRDSLRAEDAAAARLCAEAEVVNLGAVPPQIPWTAPQRYASEIARFMAFGRT